MNKKKTNVFLEFVIDLKTFRLGFAHHVVSTHKTFDFSDISFLILTIQVGWLVGSCL